MHHGSGRMTWVMAHASAHLMLMTSWLRAFITPRPLAPHLRRRPIEIIVPEGVIAARAAAREPPVRIGDLAALPAEAAAAAALKLVA